MGNLVSQDIIQQELQLERNRQEEKFPNQHLPNGTSHLAFDELENFARLAVDQAVDDGSLTWLHVLAEEYYEACAEEDPAALREELIQVAAVAVRWIEDIDRERAGF